MKCVMLATRPQWVEKICHKIGEDETGKAIYEKRIEVRKSAPQEVPFKAYIYCCKAKPYLYKEANPPFELFLDSELYKGNGYDDRLFSGKVIGEFICDKVERLEEHIEQGGLYYILSDTFNEQAQLDNWELHDYGKGKTLYAWHISDLKIYDKPKELSEFKTPPCEKSEKACGNCKWLVKINTPDVYECECYVEDGRPIKRPPQSWCYVEELQEEQE